jgi:septum formation protein
MIFPRIILGSGSPRRRRFMELLGLPFEVCVADIDERNGRGETPGELVARLSGEKAAAVAAAIGLDAAVVSDAVVSDAVVTDAVVTDAAVSGAVVIGADTIVTLDGHLLGKPAGPEEAMAMLRRLRGRAHHVYSGVTLVPPAGAAPQTIVDCSTVWMRPYTDDEIATYVATGDPLDKAGSYAIQHAGFNPVARMRGCYASVMGLPLCRLARMLARVGAAPAVDVAAACSAFTGVTCCGGEAVEFVFEV